MHESQARPFSPKPYWNTTNFFCYGLGYHAELAVTTFNLGTPYDGRGSVAFGYKALTPLFQRRVVSLMGSLEQPLGTPKLNAVVEWFSGSHDLGSLIGGVTFHPNHTWIFVAGDKVPTSGPAFSHAKQAFVGEIGAFC
jgi:hypothetical protein